ncbi:unnamed protein product [Heterosigma akashiwo]|mmetsp:Transcript_20782/g.28626  ORF Transcript_20782/g.28626 Transcript_20782/m.28626 type:complete len:131 (-) Transcript_20782:417-809(-)
MDKTDKYSSPRRTTGGTPVMSQTRPADPPFGGRPAFSTPEGQAGGYAAASGRSPRRLPWKTVFAAITMLALGLILILTSLDFVYTGHRGSMPFFILGLIVIIPGAYASVQILGVLRRWPGYTLDHLPVFE